MQIGKERRLTLAELQKIAYEAAKIEYTDLDEEIDATTLQMAALEVTDEGTLLLVPHSRAVLAVLALHLAQQKYNIDCEVTAKIVALLNSGVAVSIPSDPVVLGKALTHFLGVSLPPNVVQRAQELAITGIALNDAIGIAQVSLPIGSLTIDSLGIKPVLDEAQDTLRPHRSIAQANAFLRVMLNLSRYESKVEVSPEQLHACENVAQTIGPVIDTLKACAKTMELELNSIALKEDVTLDNTVAKLAQQQATQALMALFEASCIRTGTTPPAELPTNLPMAVVQVKHALEKEAKVAVATVNKVNEEAEAEAKAKEEEKAVRVAPVNPISNTDDNVDEFAGMTEAQKNKILKKRAEKAAKAAAKKAAKQDKKVSLFGTGTQPAVDILTRHNCELIDTCIDEINLLVESLLSGGVQRVPKIPIGTRDYLPEQMMIRQQAFSIIRRVFGAHGAVEIDTPVFELKETLTGKYGEDSKLIYDLADQGGELLALRYDLTVPFARFLAKNSVGNIKRFHIGKVYRRDRPAIARGRYREFYQCDFDIAGTYARMVPDSECICVACDILDALPIGDFGVKLNHRRLLDAILDLCGVPADKFRTICSAVDKLDKEPWAEVKREMVEDKGLDSSVADKIGEFVLNKGEPWDMYNRLIDGKKFEGHKGAEEAMEDLRILFEYLEAMGKLKFVSFDLSLARGLDYYTGVIYEAVSMNGNTQVGSIGGGGRYDNLVAMFQGSGKQTPCVGVSVGIERVFTLMEERLRAEQGTIKQRNVDILISSAGDQFVKEKMKIARILWDAKLSAEFTQTEGARLKKELPNALDRGIPFMVIIGETELKENKVVVKDLNAKEEDTVLIDDLVAHLKKKGVSPVGVIATDES